MTALLTAHKPKLLTAAEFAERHGGDYVELVDGVVVELPMPFGNHGKLCMLIAYAIMDWVTKNDLGHVASHDSFIFTGTNPDRVRGPDVLFISYERWPRGPLPNQVIEVAPELVVEVRSPSDRWSEVMAKASEYLAAGVRVAVVVDPDSESVCVYRDAQAPQVFGRADTLTLPDVLPGFAVPVARLLG